MGDVDQNKDNNISFAEFFNHYNLKKENEFFDLIYGKGIDLHSSNNGDTVERRYLRTLIDFNIELNKCFALCERIVSRNF